MVSKVEAYLIKTLPIRVGTKQKGIMEKNEEK